MESRLELIIAIPRTRPRLGLYRCQCGEEVIRLCYNVDHGKTKSCGCYNRELAIERMEKNKAAFSQGNKRHGLFGTPTHTSWSNMIQRCTNPNRWQYPYYGGRGVTVCERWMTFENFYADMGDRPEGLSLDRIDNNKGYEPGNCKWSTRSEQARNRRKRGTCLA